MSDSGAYIISPVLGATSDSVLASSSDSIQIHGSYIKQINYWDDDDFRDEWLIVPISHNYVLEGQQTNVWCWVASARIACSQYMNSPITQELAAVKVKLGGRPLSVTPFAIDQATATGTLSETAAAIQYIMGDVDMYSTYNRIYDEATL